MATFGKIEDSKRRLTFPAGTLEFPEGWYVVSNMVFVDKVQDGIASQAVKGRIVAGPYENIDDAGDELVVYMMEMDL